MNKKLSSVIFLVSALLLLIQCAAAAAMPAIIDEADYLTDSEISELTSRLDGIRGSYDMDVAVVIEENMSGYDAESTSDDIFDYNGYGIGGGKDGILLYISKNPRNYNYSTHGYGTEVFNNNGLRYIDESVLPYLQNNNYYAALSVYADCAEELLQMAAEGSPYNEKDGMSKLITYAVVIFLPLIIAGIAMSGKTKKMKTAVPENYADSYMKQGSMNLTLSRDLFLYSIVNRTEKPKSSGGSHTSSGGESHGGRGGSY